MYRATVVLEAPAVSEAENSNSRCGDIADWRSWIASGAISRTGFLLEFGPVPEESFAGSSATQRVRTFSF